jgi:hypothetical protein
MSMHVIDDTTMQELLRFVKAHHTFARQNRVMRERALEMLVMLRQLEDLSDTMAKEAADRRSAAQQADAYRGAQGDLVRATDAPPTPMKKRTSTTRPVQASRRQRRA